VHRAPAGPKLAGLALASVALLAVRSPIGVGVAAAATLVLTVTARVGPAAMWTQLRPLRLPVPLIFAVQWALVDVATAVLLTGRVVILVALAGVVTVSTKTSDLMAAIEHALHPLAKVGIDPVRMSLVMSLAVRSVPIVAALATRVREAQRARGCERDVRAFAVPLVVGALRQADALGEALKARGLDD
jgi:biotin transport system permease protein